MRDLFASNAAYGAAAQLAIRDLGDERIAMLEIGKHERDAGAPFVRIHRGPELAGSNDSQPPGVLDADRAEDGPCRKHVVAHEQECLATHRTRDFERRAIAGVAAVDRAARRAVALDDFDDPKATWVGSPKRQHHLPRGDQFLRLGLLERAQAQRTRECARAHAQQRPSEQSPHH